GLQGEVEHELETGPLAGTTWASDMARRPPENGRASHSGRGAGSTTVASAPGDMPDQHSGQPPQLTPQPVSILNHPAENEPVEHDLLARPDRRAVNRAQVRQVLAEAVKEDA